MHVRDVFDWVVREPWVANRDRKTGLEEREEEGDSVAIKI
jgi:hypothetical protein